MPKKTKKVKQDLAKRTVKRQDFLNNVQKYSKIVK